MNLPYWPEDGDDAWQYWIDICDMGDVDFTSYVMTCVDDWAEAWFTAPWRIQRSVILARDDYSCLYCAEEASHVDHMHPLSRGGGNEWWNLVAACRTCNLRKHAQIISWADAWQREQADRIAAFADGLLVDQAV